MITGGISFFEPSFSLSRRNSFSNQIDNTVLDNTLFEPVRISSPFVVNFQEREIDRILLRGTNFKNFRIRTANNLLTNVCTNDFLNFSTSDFRFTKDYDGYYFEFDNVTSELISIEIDDPNPMLTQIIISKSIGSFRGFPMIPNFNNSMTETRQKSYLGKSFVNKRGLSRTNFKLNFNKYTFPESDLDLRENLFFRPNPFIVYPCGGLSSDFINPRQFNWNLSDYFIGQTVGNMPSRHYKNFYKGGVNSSLTIIETIDS